MQNKNNIFPLGSPVAADAIIGQGPSLVMASQKPFDWSKILKILIAVLTALAGAIGVTSCAA